MGTSEFKKDLQGKILEWINKNFDQENIPEYYVPYKPDDKCVIFFHGIGGIILYEQWFQTFSEDDGHYFINSEPGVFASSAWLNEYIKCFEAANKYLEENGKPYYYSGTNVICGYSL